MALEDLLTGFGPDKFAPPLIAGKYKGKSLIVCGDAACVWNDLEQFGCRSDHGRGKVYKAGWDFLTVNKLVETFPGNIEHAYSNEAHLLLKFIAARRNEYRHEFSGPAHTHSCGKGAQWRWPWSGRGSSALGATIVGLGLGYARIVLCGVPLDNGPHNGEPPWRKTSFLKTEVPSDAGIENSHWKEAAKHFQARVTSMSGRTKAWLGAPQTSTSLGTF